MSFSFAVYGARRGWRMFQVQKRLEDLLFIQSTECLTESECARGYHTTCRSILVSLEFAEEERRDVETLLKEHDLVDRSVPYYQQELRHRDLNDNYCRTVVLSKNLHQHIVKIRFPIVVGQFFFSNLITRRVLLVSPLHQPHRF